MRIAVINQKGGCGKTTIAINLAASLAMQGRRTLLVDMDPQGHCAVGLAVPEEQVENSIYDILISPFSERKIPLRDIVWQISQNLELAPSSIELAAFEPQLAGRDHREECLHNVLTQVEEIYDFVIIDCPPSVGLLTFNALRAADEVIIPVETGYFSLCGLTRQLETLTVLREQCRQKIKVRILASMYDVRTKLAREVLGEMKKKYNAEMFKTIINFNTKLKEASSFGQPITEYDPSSKGMRDFVELAKEIVQSRQDESFTQRITTVESQLSQISKTANELLAESRNLAGSQPHSVSKQKMTLQEKLDNFYGVRQQQGKVQFVGLYPKASEVYVAGDFNNWNPRQTALANIDDNGRWLAELGLPNGVYRYRYIVDGRWQQDPYNEHTEINEFGEFNSVVEVK